MTAPRWRYVALLLATAVAGFLARVNITVTGEPIMREFGLTQSQMGRVFSALVLGYALLMVPGGLLADRWGTRRVLIAAAAAWVVCTVAIAAAGLGAWAALGILPVLIAMRFLLGAAEAPTYPAAALGVAKWIPRAQRGRANGIVLASIGLGSAIAPPLVTAMMIHWGWRAALVITALPAALVSAAWWAVSEPVATASGAPAAQSELVPANAAAEGGTLRTRSFAVLTASYTLQGYVGYIFVFWFYLYLVQVRKFALLESAWLATLPWVLSIGSIPLGGWLSDKLAASRLGVVWGRRLVPMVCLSAGGAMLALGAHTSSAHLAAMYLALSTAVVLAVEGPFWATMLSVSGRRPGAAGGIMNMGCNVGGFISPALTPVLAAAIGWENALLIAAALAVVAGLLWLGVTPGR